MILQDVLPGFTWFSTDFGFWLSVLFDATIKGSLILLVAGIVACFLRRGAAANRHLIWTLALVSLLFLPAFEVALPHWKLPLLPGSVTRVDSASYDVSSSSPSLTATAPALEVYPDLSPNAAYQPALKVTHGNAFPQFTVNASWGRYAVLLWLVGFVFSLMPIIFALIDTSIIRLDNNRLAGKPWQQLLQSLADKLELSTSVTVLQSELDTIPMTWGTFRPTILLPHNADQWPHDRRQMVLLHELSHIKRRDCATQFLAQVACAVYWFNPLVWFGAKRLRIEREKACDDMVLSMGSKSSDYADQLLKIVSSLSDWQFSSMAAVTMARKSQFESRLLAILDASRSRRAVTRIALFAGVLTALIFVTPLATMELTAAAEEDNEKTLEASTNSAAKTVTIPAGARIDQIAELMAASGLVTKTDALYALSDQKVRTEMGFRSITLEGWVLPGDYQFSGPIDAGSMVIEMFLASGKKAGEVTDRAAALGFTVQDMLTLASIIEKEAKHPDDRQKLSMLYHNRLRIGMPLQSEQALRYGAHKFTAPLTREDFRNPMNIYNTFLETGLPSTPICSPSKESIQAALYPQDSADLYFFYKDSGPAQFFNVLEEYKAAVGRNKFSKAKGEKMPSKHQREKRPLQRADHAVDNGTLIDTYAKLVIFPNVPLIREDITDKSLTDLPKMIPPGYRAVTINVNAVGSVEDYTRPNTRVDIVWTFTNRDRKKKVATIVRSARILSFAKQSAEGAAKEEKDGANTVIVLVTQKDAQKIQLARNTGTLSLVLSSNVSVRPS